MAVETSLKQMFSTLMDVRTSGVIIGEVISTSPLEIRAENDAKLIITESNCYVPKHLSSYSVSIHIPGIGTESCRISNSLKKGDKVFLLSFERGALYYCLDKVGD